MDRRPAVVYWYWAYCALYAVVLFAATALGVWATLQPVEEGDSLERGELLFYCFLCGALALMHAAGPFLPRGKASWILGMVLFAFDMSTICC